MSCAHLNYILHTRYFFGYLFGTYLVPVQHLSSTYPVLIQCLSSTYPVLIQYLALKKSQFLYFYSVAGPQHHITHNNSRFIALAAAELFNYYFLLLGSTLLLPLPKVCLKQLSLPISTAITTYNNGLIDPTCGLRYLCINVITIRFCFDTTNV